MRFRDTADKNKALNESLPYYELNAANYDEISYNGLTYTITDECLEMSELQEEIGQVSKRFKNVAGEDFSFGYVYSIVDVDPCIFTYRFKLILKANNLPLNLNVHSLRHTNASLLIAQGVDVRTVASLLGHAQASTTLDIYAHAFDKNKRMAQEKLGKAIGL